MNLRNSGDNEICNGSSTDLELELEGTGPFTYNYEVDGVPGSASFTNSGLNDFTVTRGGTYTFVSLTDGTSCPGTGTGTATVVELDIPEVEYFQKGGKQGIHSEHMGYLLSEMQYMQRTYPNSKW